MSSTPSAYPQVVSGPLALFRVLKSSIFPGQTNFRAGFDSRQLHKGISRSEDIFALACFLLGTPCAIGRGTHNVGHTRTIELTQSCQRDLRVFIA
jgi:hypothetical protein